MAEEPSQINEILDQFLGSAKPKEEVKNNVAEPVKPTEAKEVKPKREKKIPIPKDSASFFRARAKHPRMFNFTSDGNLQVPEMRGQAAKVIDLPSYKPVPQGESQAELERRDQLVNVEKEFDETLQSLKQAMEEWRATGASAEAIKYQRELTRLDALRSQLRSPLRFIHEYKRLSIRQVLVDEFYQVKKIGYPVYGLQLRSRPFQEYAIIVKPGEDKAAPIDLEGQAQDEDEEQETFVFFSDPADPEYGALSPDTMVEFIFNSTKYNSLIQAYEVERITQLGRRKDFAPLLLKSRSATQIRMIGSRITGEVENPRELWIQILTNLIAQHPRYVEILRNTGDDTLVYANPKEGRWGIGLSEEDPLAMERKSWKGPNLLGQAWQVVRSKLPPVEEGEGEEEEEEGQSGGAYTDHGKTLEEAKEQRANVLKGYYRRGRGV
uniref:NADAR domain-containing protein n=1 Tax=viral metagenome TaxID=1070528 RepID=A0A6C0KJX9_9ZZZZ